MFKKLTTLILGLTFLAACSPAPTASVFLKQVELNDSTQQIEVPEDIKTSIFEMATEITPDYFLASDKDNQIFSPLSLWYALGVLREGATNETLAEINEMMKLPADFDSSKVIPELSKTLNFMEASKLAKDKSKHGIRLTNGIFFDESYKDNILESYLQKAADIWGTETAQVDFTNEKETKEIIKNWVSDKTDEFIDDYEATFAKDGSAILNIYNVLYLKDLWLNPFTKLDAETFYAPQGDILVPFIQQVDNNIPYHDHELARAAAFSGEKGIRVWFLLPKGDNRPIDLIPELQSILADSEDTYLDFKAPALDIDGENLSLKDLLEDKGYTRLFNEAQLDNMLTGLEPVVSEIKQKTKLQMDEKGFKAAAVTEIGIAETSAPADPPIEFYVDQPYLLVIEYQGLPLFISQITNPVEH